MFATIKTLVKSYIHFHNFSKSTTSQRVEKAEMEAKILTCEVKSDKKSIPISLYNPTHNSVLMHFNV